MLIVWSFYEEEVDVMTTLAFVGHVQRNEAVVITFAQNGDAYGRILPFKFGNVFDGHWEGEAGKVRSVLIWEVV